MARLKHGLTDLNAGRLVGKSRLIETEMDGNAHFPNPQPALADVAAKRKELQAAITAAANGDRKAIGVRNTIHDQLVDMLKTLSEYVSMIAKGSGTIIESSGFGLANPKSPPQRVTRPQALSIVRAETEGEVNINWKSVRYSRSYIVERTTTDPALPDTQWEQISLPSRANYTDRGLTPGTHYWYRIRAIGSINMSSYSNVGLIMAA